MGRVWLFIFLLALSAAAFSAQNEMELSVFESPNEGFRPVNNIDRALIKLLSSRGISAANRASDAVLLRRAYLTLTGTLPTADFARKYLADKSAGKYSKLVDSLLESEDFNVYWTMKFADILRIKAEFPVNLWPNAAQAYNRFVYKCLYDRVPYSAMAYAMLTSSGSNFRVGEVNFFRALQSKTPQGAAAAVALTFMCARFDKMPKEIQGEMPRFFERLKYKDTKEWKEEIVFDDPASKAPFGGVFPDSSKAAFGAGESPREAFAKWLTSKGNPYFSRAFANRAWAWIFGRSLTKEVDDMFYGSEVSNKELLDVLASEFERCDFDIRKFFKTIVMSNAYMQSCIARSDSADASRLFAFYPVRRMDAEVLIDALCSISGGTEIYGSTTPEPYTQLPDNFSAKSIPDGSISTSFLELFGKSPRDTGYASERVSAPSSAQRLHMANSSHIRAKIERSTKLRRIYGMKIDKFLEEAYLMILTRYPTAAEKRAFSEYAKSKAGSGWRGRVDLVWALVNSEEFLNVH